MTSPAFGLSRPEIVRSVVVLPAPFAPMSVTISPFSHIEVDAAQRGDGAVRDFEIADAEERGS